MSLRTKRYLSTLIIADVRPFLEHAIATNRLGLYRKRKLMTKSCEELGLTLMGDNDTY